MAWEFRDYKDLGIIFVAKMLRTFAFGMLVLTLIDLLYYKGINTVQIGVIMVLSVCGNIILSCILTHTLGVKALILAALLMVMAGLIFIQFKSIFLIGLASLIGIISITGNETGPFKAIEQQYLSNLIYRAVQTPQKRKKITSTVQTLHNLVGYACQAAGIYYAGNYILSTQQDCHNNQQSFYDVMATYAMLATAIFILYCLLGKFSQEKEPSEVQPLGPIFSSKWRVGAAYVVLVIEAFAGSLVIYPFLDYFYEIRFFILSKGEIVSFLVRCCISGGIGYLLSKKIFNCLGAKVSRCIQIASSIFLILVFQLDDASLSFYLFFAYFFLAQLDNPLKKHLIINLIPRDHALTSTNVARLANSFGLVLGLIVNTIIMIFMPARYILHVPFLIAGSARIFSGVMSGLLLVFKIKEEGALEIGSTEMSEHIEK